jgi:type IV secretory pathway TrbD component
MKITDIVRFLVKWVIYTVYSFVFLMGCAVTVENLGVNNWVLAALGLLFWGVGKMVNLTLKTIGV